MVRSYLPVLFLLGFVTFNAVVIIGLSALITRPRPTPVKQQPYELTPYEMTPCRT